MAVTKRTVSFDPEVWADVAQIAANERIGVSTVVNRALRHELRIRKGLAGVAEWEAEHEAITPEELAEADRILDEAGVSDTRLRHQGHDHRS
jgi:predicted transcriptional regulator